MTTTRDGHRQTRPHMRLIPIHAADGTRRHIAAIETRTDGLLAHHADFHAPGYHRWWAVTHETSGLPLPTYFPNPSLAVDFANALDGLTDWQRQDPARPTGFADRYRRAEALHGGVGYRDLEPDHSDTIARYLNAAYALITIASDLNVGVLTATCHGAGCGWTDEVVFGTPFTGKPESDGYLVDMEMLSSVEHVQDHASQCTAPEA